MVGDFRESKPVDLPEEAPSAKINFDSVLQVSFLIDLATSAGIVMRTLASAGIKKRSQCSALCVPKQIYVRPPKSSFYSFALVSCRRASDVLICILLHPFVSNLYRFELIS